MPSVELDMSKVTNGRRSQVKQFGIEPLLRQLISDGDVMLEQTESNNGAIQWLTHHIYRTTGIPQERKQ
jgi:hypothetical protein